MFLNVPNYLLFRWCLRHSFKLLQISSTSKFLLCHLFFVRNKDVRLIQFNYCVLHFRRGQYISLWDLIGAIDKDTIECTYQFFNGSTPSRILKSWFHQAGYPVVTVNVLRDRTPNAIQLKQVQHFFYIIGLGSTCYSNNQRVVVLS